VETRYIWDARKAKNNQRKHGVSFETAREVFEDPNQVVSESYFIEDEQRMQVIGMTRGFVLLLVVFVDRSEPDLDLIRIISARKANAYERKIYAAQSQNH